jgi:hypothetical protein
MNTSNYYTIEIPYPGIFFPYKMGYCAKKPEGKSRGEEGHSIL